MTGSTTKKILIADDMPENVEFLKETVSKWNYEALTAHNGMEALRVARESNPDLILLDIIMPDLTGYEVCRELKMQSETADIPVILLTAKGEIFDRVDGLTTGTHDYITRPFHKKELKARIETALYYKLETDKLKKETEHLRSMSVVDEVTGFYNRRFLKERLEEEISRAKRYWYDLALVFVYPDNFKTVRAEHGTLYGDNIIKQIAALIRKNTRAIDIVTRYSDDAFAIILPQTGSKGTRVFSKKIIRVVDRHLFYGILEKTKITVSVGSVVYGRENLSDVETFISTCDKAVREALHRGSSYEVVEI
jgi:two-component system, cell cycle response regulator